MSIAYHRDSRLIEAFEQRPYQGACPITARFLFVGLDANFCQRIDKSLVYCDILDYLNDGVGFWQRNEIHHPFLLADYSGDGKLFHQRFSDMKLSSDIAPLISFVELVNRPTTGRNKIAVRDLDCGHIDWLRSVIDSPSLTAVFWTPTVLRVLMRKPQFKGITQPVDPWYSPTELGRTKLSNKVDVYIHYHFSAYGRYDPKHHIRLVKNIIESRSV